MFTNELSAKQSKLLSFFFFSFLFPPKKIQRCCAGGGSVQDGSKPSSPPGPGPPIPHAVPHSAPPHGAPLCARSHRSPGPARPQQRSRTAELPAAPASRARPVPLSGTARLPSPVPVPAPTPTPERGSDGTAPLWGRPRKGGAVPNRAGPILDGGSAPSPAAAAPPWHRGSIGTQAVPYESFLFSDFGDNFSLIYPSPGQQPAPKETFL